MLKEISAHFRVTVHETFVFSLSLENSLITGLWTTSPRKAGKTNLEREVRACVSKITELVKACVPERVHVARLDPYTVTALTPSVPPGTDRRIQHPFPSSMAYHVP